MKTSGINVPIADAEAPLLRLALHNGECHMKNQKFLENGIFTGGDIFYCPQNGLDLFYIAHE